MLLHWVKMSCKALLLTILTVGCGNKKMTNEKLFFELEIKSENIGYYIDLNDTDIFREASGNPVSFTLPANHWVLNGENKIKVAVDFEEKNKLELSNSSSLIVNFNMRIKVGEQQTTQTLSQFMLRPAKENPEVIASRSSNERRMDSKNLFQLSKDGDVLASEWVATEEGNWIDFDSSIFMDLGYPRWAYLDADFLGDPDTMSDEEYFGLSDNLHEAYGEIWALMNAKDKDALLEKFKLRSSEYDKAFYLPEGEKLADMAHSLESAFNHKSLKLDKLYESEYSQITIVANGKVAILTAASSNEPIISYSHPEGAFHRTYNMYFMRKDGEWIVIR